MIYCHSILIHELLERHTGFQCYPVNCRDAIDASLGYRGVARPCESPADAAGREGVQGRPMGRWVLSLPPSLVRKFAFVVAY